MKRIQIILLTILCSLFTIHCHAQLQGQAKIDSLLKELPRHQEDTNKANLLVKLAMMYYLVNPDSGLICANKALKISQQLSWERGVAIANRSLGVNYTSLGDYPTALKYCLVSNEQSERLGDKKAIMEVSSSLVIIYVAQGEYAKALEPGKRALKLSEELGNKQTVSLNACNLVWQFQRKLTNF